MMGRPARITQTDTHSQATMTISHAHYTTRPGDQFSQPQHGGWLLITVDIVATKGSTDFNPLYFTLIGPDGSRWNPDLTTGGYSPALAAGTLNAGSKTHGYVAFDVPQSATGHGAKVAATSPLGSDIAYWAVR